MNSVNLVGRLTKDPELRYTQSGVATVKFNLAVNRTVKREGQPEAEFISCAAFNKTAENLANYQKKGNLISVSGRIQTGSYEKDGQRIYTTDVMCDNIQYLEKRQEGQQQQSYQSQQQFNNQQKNQNNHYNQKNFNQQQNVIVNDDILPF